MMRAFFITACVLSLMYVVLAAAAVQEVENDRDMAWSHDYDYNSYDSGNPYSYDSSSEEMYQEEAHDASRMGGIFSLLFMLISAVVFTLALMKIKTQTMKVISIIGLSISGLFLLWAFLPVASPGAASFDEIGPAFIVAGIALLGLIIVGIVQAFNTRT